MQKSVFILSDIHYACAAEQARPHHEIRAVKNPFLRVSLRLFRNHIWLRDPYHQNHLLDEFLQQADGADFVVANGDYSCDTAFVGVMDDAACQSAADCLGQLRRKFGENFRATLGDHELGKISLLGDQGGLRLASWHRSVGELALAPFWKMEIGVYILLGVTSTLLALPVFAPDTLAAEKNEWHCLREMHLTEIRQAFTSLKPKQKVILFCHDPSALPFLWHEETVRQKIAQVEQTVIGHLHSPLIFWKSQRLAGMPRLDFLGNSARRMSAALREARHWRAFRPRLCPSLAGLELLKDGGYLRATIDLEGKHPAIFERKRIQR